MVFNSLTFLVFVLLFFPLYFGTRGRLRLWVILLASYIFYGWWDWRFLSLIVFSTAMDWWFGQWITYLDDPVETQADWQRGSAVQRFFGRLTRLAARTGWRRHTVLLFSMVINLGFLGVFKYFNFFAESLVQFVGMFGLQPSWTTLNIILPVGISFYTFQSMSYTIDVYRREIPYEPSLLKFAGFIALFPQLVAGPIVRARDLLHQMNEDKAFSWRNWNSGLGRVLWGFFKKIAVADSLAPFVDQVFAAPETFSSMHLLIGVVFY
jgi:alginate O-acetyltransferase complex protein AlgI